MNYFHSNIKDYINYNYNKKTATAVSNNYEIIKKHKNIWKVNFAFYRKYNNIDDDLSDSEVAKHISNKGILKGYLYHPIQLMNFFNLHNYQIMKQGLHFKVKSKSQIHYVNANYFIDVLKKFNFEDYISHIDMVFTNIDETSVKNIADVTLFTVFIGDFQIFIKILNKILNSRNVDVKSNSNIFSFVMKKTVIKDFENSPVYTEMKKKIKNLIIFTCYECGNDIIPALQANYYMFEKFSNINYVYKFQTKSKINDFELCTNYLLDNSFHSLKKLYLTNKNNSVTNLVAHKISSETKVTYMAKTLCEKYTDYIDKNKQFIAFSIYFTHKEVIQSVLEFIKNNNYRAYFLNNMYDNSIINFKTTPIHFLEYLLGVIKIDS